MKLIFWIFLCVLKNVGSTYYDICDVGRAYADDNDHRTIEHSNNGGTSQHCSMIISPDEGFGNGYFLEITWIKFLIPDDMPKCKDSYIEVFLTSSYRSIGRFCSKNIGGAALFNMYSPDGYARITYHTKKTGKKSEFEFSYAMLSTQSEHLGTDTGDVDLKGKSGNINSARWPQGYPDSSCVYKLTGSSSKEMKIIFMDVDFAHSSLYSTTTCTNLDDNLQVRGTDNANDQFESQSSRYIKSYFCQATSVTTDAKYVFIKFSKTLRTPLWIHRGFVAGYITYDKQSPLSAATIAGIAVGVFVLVLLIGMGFWCKKRAKRRKAMMRQNATAEQQLTNGEQPIIIDDSSTHPPNYDLDSAKPTSMDQPPSYSAALYHAAASTPNLSLPNEAPPPYDGVLLLQPMATASVSNQNASSSQEH